MAWIILCGRRFGPFGCVCHNFPAFVVVLQPLTGFVPCTQSGARQLAQHAEKFGITYDSIVARIPTDLNETFARDIEVDLGRTFPEHPSFASPTKSPSATTLESSEGVDKLRRILSAYCLLHPGAGYLQSMNFVGAFLLVALNGCEVDAFWMLIALTDHMLEGYYDVDMPALRKDSQVFDALLRTMLPTVAAHCEAHRFDVQFVLPRWLLCGYLHCLPFEVTVRVWDCMMVAGRQAPKVLLQVRPVSLLCASLRWLH